MLGYGEAVLATGALHRSLGLTDDELVAIEGILGREPGTGKRIAPLPGREPE